jgi:hypothetical protein
LFAIWLEFGITECAFESRGIYGITFDFEINLDINISGPGMLMGAAGAKQLGYKAA